MFPRSIHLSALHGPRKGPNYVFNNASNCAGHFLWSRFRKWRIPTDGFNAIILQDDGPGQDPAPRTSGTKSFVIPFDFDPDAWTGMSEHERHEHLLGLYKRGFRVTAEHHPLPLDRLLPLRDEFRDGGYRNRWLGAKKQLRCPDATLRAELHGEITLERFTLRLRVLAGDEVRFEEQLLDTNPNPVSWQHKWKGLERDGDDLVVTDRMHRGDGLRRIPLAKFR
ncbi:MAG: hypothetical protein KAI24_24710 [Planctomycetes bacterium]|nr:hypothetical protein [Planctomycetota bacterium]